MNNKSEFRKKAEQKYLLKNKNISADTYILSKEKELIHEREIHKLELELQNEELLRSREELEESRLKYYDLYDLAPCGYLTVDDRGIILNANLTSTTIFEVGKIKLLNSGLSSFIEQDFAYDLRCFLTECLKSLKKQSCELKIKKDGGLSWVKLDGIAIPDKIKSDTSTLITITDINKRKLSEERLFLKNKVFDASLSAQSISDCKGFLIEVNSSFLKIWGFSNKVDVVGRSISFFLKYEHDSVAMLEALDKTGSWTGEYTAKRSDGSTFTAYAFASVILDNNDEMIGYQSSVIDISERKIAEQNLQNNEKKLKRMTVNSPAALYQFTIDPDGTCSFPYVSKKVLSILDLSDEDIMLDSSKFFDMVHPDDKIMLRESIMKGVETLESFPVEFRFLKSGEVIHLETLGDPKTLSDGGIIWYGYLLDITLRKKAEQELLKAKEFTDATIESLPGIFYIFDKNGHYIKWNKNFTNVSEYSDEEIEKINPLDLFEGEGRKHIENRIMETFTKGESDAEADFLTKSGKKIPYYFTGRLLTIGEKPYLVGMGIDISKRKQYEELSLKNQKLESIGTLAGGIAHDFNNILMEILGNNSLAKMKFPKAHPGYRHLEESELSISRAAKLANFLLTFSSGGAPIKENTKLGKLIEEIAQLDLSGSNVKLDFKQAEDLWVANVDKQQIQQVFSNLTINAIQAMPNGGVLYIRFNNVDIAENTVQGLSQGKYIKTTVQDEGVGIDYKNFNRVFDPFFSTKEIGRGLGLSTSYSIIKKHGGYISFDSELGKGTTFTLYIPTSEVQLRSKTKQLGVTEYSKIEETSRILVMDDDVMICDILKETLETIGFTVVTVLEGKQAIEIYKQLLDDEEPFDAVIMDLTIPGGMGGEEAVRELLKIDPKAKCIISSGYANDPVMANYAEYGFKANITKPYFPNKLREVLSQVLKE